MSDYLEARVEAIRVIAKLTEVHAEYKQIATTGGPGAQRELLALIGRSEMTLREGITDLGNNPRLQTVISAEPPLLQTVNTLATFWMWLQQNQLVEVGEGLAPKLASTNLPPIPHEEITGQAVMDYLTSLNTWIRGASSELWEEDSPVQLPQLGSRYGIGDFGHTMLVADILGEGAGLRSHWIQLAACGAYWDTVGVGSARAKLIFKGVEILERLLHPPS